MKMLKMFIKSSLLILFGLIANLNARFTEEERVVYWKQHHTWPPSRYNESEGYLALQRSREEEIMQLTGGNERWENWMQFVQGPLCPKFTSRGFDVINVPKDIFQKLSDSVEKALEDFDNLPEESFIKGLYGESRPKFIYLDELAYQILDELKSLHESWAGGIKLVGTSAYGVRMYTNGSSLLMHHDKIETHVISSIVHITHKYDNDSRPWPIQIEDHDGNLHSVNLKAGEMLFYESARCLHGRMAPLRGKYYGSIFLHYKPVDKSLWNFEYEDVVNAVPPHWNEGIIEEEGSRWAGQGITIDSRAAAGTPPRVVNGVFIHDRKSPHAEL